MLRALVLHSNAKTDLGDLVRISKAEASKREHLNQNISIKAIIFVAELGVFCAIYEVEELRGALNR